MKRMFTLNRKSRSRWMLLLLLLVAGVTNTLAQNVTVKPSTGSMIAAVPENIGGTSGDYDTFYRRGGFATWRHNQLCLTMTTSDAPGLTADGQLANPANNLFGRTSTNEIEMGRGALQATRTCYMNLVLPKGYRFTGYEIVFSRNRADFGNDGYSNNANTNGTTIFGETDANFNFLTGFTQTCTYDANATLEEGSVSISKEDETGMTNVLYFKLTDNNTGTGRMVITFHSITLYFTAEDDYSPVAAASQIATPVSAVDIPFSTGKVDYGTIKERTYNGQTRVSYSSASVKDMAANFVLYEAESVKDGTHFDGTTGKVVEYKTGSIYSYNEFFRLGKTGAEQVYYIESPTYVVLPDANETKNPVGFRIVGAELEYQYASAQGASTVTTTKHYITYTSGGTTYYLDKTGHFVTGTQTEWEIDDNNYVHSGNVYLTYTRSGNTNYTYSLSVGLADSDNKVRIYNNYLYINAPESRYSWSNTTFYVQGTTSSTATPTFTTGNSNRASWTTTTSTVTVPAFTPAPFKLHVYGKDGVELEDSPIEVNSSADNGKITLNNLNNDAIKFGVEGIGLVKGTITMQALDPYINRMTVVCQDQDEDEIRMTETFTSNDFSVSGGEFFFYLPSDCIGHTVKISYEDLWSRYADETYTGGSSDHNSRFSFVNSEHYNQYTSDNIYSNTTEAAADQSSVHERQIVDNVGAAKFRFNNADQMQGTGGTLTEYPFTKANYAAAPNNGSFYTMQYNVTSADQVKTGYVFTTDETRYNIAPTTAVQHRTYAYYEMKVHVQSSTYDPKVKFEKVYDAAFYDNDGTNTGATAAFYGAIITAPYGTPVKQGFASDYEIQTVINDAITLGKDSENNTDIPTNKNQILYVDMTQLAGYYTNSQAEMSMTDYKNTLGKNALIFMPKGVTVTHDAVNNNFAYLTEGNNLRAANNIIITDKNPFFSPYDIQLPSGNYAEYTRTASKADYNATQYATVILPFTVALEDGQHTDKDGLSTLEFMQMNTNNATSDKGYNYQPAMFFTKTSDAQVDANTPYALKVVSNAGTGSFTVRQYDKNIIATPAEAMSGNTLFSAKTISATGNLTDKNGVSNTYSFSHKGSFSGYKIPKNSPVTFYFANNGFYSSAELNGKYPNVELYPYRTVYEVISGGSAKVGFLHFVEGENTTGIIDIEKNNYSGIATGDGTITITADAAGIYRIFSAAGQNANTVVLKAGETRTVNVPAGVYLVNGVKVLVK